MQKSFVTISIGIEPNSKNRVPCISIHVMGRLLNSPLVYVKKHSQLDAIQF